MTDIWTYLKNCNKNIVLYGTGNGADKILDELERNNIPVSGVFASDSFVRDRFFRGMRVMSFSEAKEKFPDMSVLMCFGSSRPEVLENIRKISAECELLAPDVPVYGDNIFNLSFYEKHIDELERVRAVLADELSVKTLENHIKYKLTGKIEYLYECETDKAEESSIIDLPENAVFVDLGAYNGDTVKEFVEKCPSYAEIIAVEPDKRSFRKLCENTAELVNINCVRAVIGDRVEDTFFDSKKGRGSHEAATGECIPSLTVDSLLNGKRVDFIKMDVEGNELKAISGAEHSIKTYKPKMLVSCYHRSEDLFTLPLRILEINPDYKVYMRHLPYIPAWDTAFYFV
ncbi:MAG: FkbM family methyltransferase [Clostridia bacterium]|nr:FkbM family methyltransferase [Clostridia bacterium]